MIQCHLMMLGSPGRIPRCRLRSTSLADTGSKRLLRTVPFHSLFIYFPKQQSPSMLYNYVSCCGWSRVIREGSSSGWIRVERKRWNCDLGGLLTPDSNLSNIFVKHAFVMIVGLCMFAYSGVP